jgi:hypothetical protein
LYSGSDLLTLTSFFVDTESISLESGSPVAIALTMSLSERTASALTGVVEDATTRRPILSLAKTSAACFIVALGLIVTGALFTRLSTLVSLSPPLLSFPQSAHIF